MGVSDNPSPADSGSEGSGITDEQYEWLQQQLAHIGNLHITAEAADDDEAEWADPSGGTLLNIFAACEEGDATQLAAHLADLAADAGAAAAAAGGYSINTPGPDGDTALHLASLYGHLGCVQLLLDAGGADAAAINPDDGTSALHDAAAGGYLAIAQLLLARAGPGLLPLQDTDGDTPLHNAARGGHAAVVAFLLQQGAPPGVANAAGRTPADEADEPELQQQLRDAAAAAAAGGGGAAAAGGGGQPVA